MKCIPGCLQQRTSAINQGFGGFEDGWAPQWSRVSGLGIRVLRLRSLYHTDYLAPKGL